MSTYEPTWPRVATAAARQTPGTTSWAAAAAACSAMEQTPARPLAKAVRVVAATVVHLTDPARLVVSVVGAAAAMAPAVEARQPAPAALAVAAAATSFPEAPVAVLAAAM